MLMIVVFTKLLYSSLLKSPTPKTKAGTPNIPATVFLSISTDSFKAMSFKLNGFTCSTSSKASGTIQGSPDWLVVRYFLAIFSRPSTVPSSSLDESTLIIRLGMFFPFMKPFLVCVAMFKLRTISFKANLKPVPI